MQRRKKSEKSKLIESLDIEWSKKIRGRDGYICQKCKENGNDMFNQRNHAAHVFSRGNMSTRWDLENGITLCYYHHIHWCHRQPLEFARWCKQRFGEKKYKELEEKSLGVYQFTKNDYEKVLSSFGYNL